MKKFLGTKVLLALGAAALSLGITTSSARADFTLDMLIAGTATGTMTTGGVTYTGTGSGIIVGDKLFDNFSYSASGTMPTALGVHVSGVNDIFGNIGVGFQGGFNDSPFSPTGRPSDALIKFRVTVLDPNSVITDAHIFGNPTVQGGTGHINVNETFSSPQVPGGIANAIAIQATNNGITPPTFNNTDSTVFATPVTVLNVQKDIFALAGTGIPSLSFVDQTFSQKTRHVPEPASFALVGLGLLGTGFAAYRRRKLTV